MRRNGISISISTLPPQFTTHVFVHPATPATMVSSKHILAFFVLLAIATGTGEPSEMVLQLPTQPAHRRTTYQAFACCRDAACGVVQTPSMPSMLHSHHNFR